MNESTHERLNRELARMRTHDVGFWGGWALLIGIVALYAFLSLNHITNARYVTGTAGAITPLITESGTRIQMSITVEGQARIIQLPSRLVHPAVGDEICLRAGERRFTGNTSYAIVAESLCDGTSATEQVE